VTILWEPSAERVAAAAITRFARALEREHGVSLPDYSALHRFSVGEPARFWPSLWRELGIVADGAPTPTLADPAAAMQDARWFPEVRLSFAENLLRRRDDAPAIVACSATGPRRVLSWRDLHDQVGRVAAALAAAGVTEGDRVGGILPNAPEAVVGMLAVNSLGAIWSLVAPDLGVDGVADRFGQIEPNVLVVTAAGGTRADPLRRVRMLVERLPTVERVIVIDAPADAVAASGLPGATRWDDLLAGPPAPLAFRRLPFDHPAFILYTSGTTGMPKCIVHGMGGQLVQLLKELRLHYDLGPGDRFFYRTSPGWNMWYWVVIALAAEATIVLWDGTPFVPRLTALFDLVDAEQVDVFGVSPSYLAMLRTGGARPRDLHSLASMRTLLSTGSPLSPELFDWVYDAVKPDVCLSSISGGTEINACFATGNPAGPVRRGELQVLALGMATEVWNDAGQPVRGELGELVCTRTFPSQPVGFWNDPGRARYLATYFERFPGVWHHGDLAELTASDGLVIQGRSDATLKPGGHRIGTSEIYNVVENLPEVADSIAIGQRWRDDVRIVLFVQLAPGATLDAALVAKIRQQLALDASQNHVPARVLAVGDVPRTSTGKKAELAVRAIVHGEPVKNTSALANPESLDDYRRLVDALST
jgi:acetoacetyl-CoA synthetase